MQRILLVVGICTIALPSPLCADLPRFSAMLANGQRIEGALLHDWHQDGSAPKIDNQELMHAGNPLSWLRDRTLRPGPVPRAYLEMTNGDRLPGEVIGFSSESASSGRPLPPHFLVRPTVNVSWPHGEAYSHVRVLARFVQRIVRQSSSSRAQFQPGTLYPRRGSAVRFRAVRFAGNQVRLLTDDGPRSFALGDVVELHLPTVDPWDAYLDELALISPRGDDRLLQFDSTDGAIFTASMANLRIAQSDPNLPDQWLHALQPAWSLDGLWLQNTRIWLRRSWAVDQVPLSRLLPTQAINKRLLGGGNRQWRANLNIEGRPLQANAQLHGWGFGVHAYSELHFPLPEIATGFRTRVGLDDVAGTGGCVIARVFAGSTTNPPLYQSPHLVGSKSVQDTGLLDLTKVDPQQRTLILQVDAAEKNRPQQSDPLDIRDIVDWLDPTVMLDPVKLREAIRPRVTPAMLGFDEWQVSTHPAGDYAWQSVWAPYDHPYRGRFLHAVRVQQQPFTLARTVKVGPRDRWLIVSTYRHGMTAGEPEITVRIDGVNVATGIVPLRNEVHRPLLIPLSLYLGHEIRIEVVASPASNTALPPVHWHSVEIAEQAPTIFGAIDDDGPWAPVLNNETSTAKWVESDKYSGRRSLEVTPGGGHRLAIAEPIEVRGAPNELQKRYLHFAVQKVGAGELSIELEHPEMNTRPAIYTAGIVQMDDDNSHEVVWVDDELPPGATVNGTEGGNSWKWSGESDAPVLSGKLAMKRVTDGFQQHSFSVKEKPLELVDGDRLLVYVFIDPQRPPQQLILQVLTADGNWERRAYWGDNRLGLGGEGSPALRKMGPIPPTGQWVRLEVPTQLLNLHAHTPIAGFNLSQFGGAVTWDKIGKRTLKEPPQRKSVRVSNLEVDGRWTYVARDVLSDFGNLDITGVVVRTSGGQCARFDHMYFVRTGEDVPSLPQVPSPEGFTPAVRQMITEQLRDRSQPSTVAIEIDGRLVTGAIIGNEGYVLTAGNLLGAPGKAAIVQLVDGHRLPAKTLGICRSANLGLLQITDRQDATLVGMELHEQRDFSPVDVYVGMSMTPFVIETPGAEPYLGRLQQIQTDTLWTDLQIGYGTPGGPLVARHTRIIGTQIGRSPYDGALLYTNSVVARQNWDRMKSGEMYGEWFPGTGPRLGMELRFTADGAKIAAIEPNSATHAADVKVGDLVERLDGQTLMTRADLDRLLNQRDDGAEVTLDLVRGGQKLQPKVKLAPRVP